MLLIRCEKHLCAQVIHKARFLGDGVVRIVVAGSGGANSQRRIGTHRDLRSAMDKALVRATKVASTPPKLRSLSEPRGQTVGQSPAALALILNRRGRSSPGHAITTANSMLLSPFPATMSIASPFRARNSESRSWRWKARSRKIHRVPDRAVIRISAVRQSRARGVR
jgi:hypothetical protein